MNQNIRTPEDFVGDMLERGRDWIAVMAVASAVRGGRWYDQCRQILQDKGLMPSDRTAINKAKSDAAKIMKEPPPKYKTGKKKMKVK